MRGTKRFDLCLHQDECLDAGLIPGLFVLRRTVTALVFPYIKQFDYIDMQLFVKGSSKWLKVFLFRKATAGLF
jgi:hypothetical protein